MHGRRWVRRFEASGLRLLRTLRELPQLVVLDVNVLSVLYVLNVLSALSCCPQLLFSVALLSWLLCGLFALSRLLLSTVGRSLCVGLCGVRS